MVRYANPIRPEFSRRESIEESGFALTMTYHYPQFSDDKISVFLLEIYNLAIQ